MIFALAATLEFVTSYKLKNRFRGFTRTGVLSEGSLKSTGAPRYMYVASALNAIKKREKIILMRRNSRKSFVISGLFSV